MTKDYIGMTSNTFKVRYGNQKMSFTNAKYVSLNNNFQNVYIP